MDDKEKPTMFKIYLRTLIKSIRYVATFLGVMFIGGALIYVVASFFLTLTGVSTLIVLGTPTVVTFIVSIHTREEYNDIEKAYQRSCDTNKQQIGADLKRIFRSKEYWIELLVFCHYLALLYIIAYRIIHGTPVRNVMIIIGSVILFMILNAASWLFVHRTYLKNKVI